MVCLIIVITMLVYCNELYDSKISCDLVSQQFCLFLLLILFIIALAIGFMSKFRKDYMSSEFEVNLSRVLEGLRTNHLDADWRHSMAHGDRLFFKLFSKYL